MKITGEKVTFETTGRTTFATHGIIGIDENCSVTEGL